MNTNVAAWARLIKGNGINSFPYTDASLQNSFSELMDSQVGTSIQLAKSSPSTPSRISNLHDPKILSNHVVKASPKIFYHDHNVVSSPFDIQSINPDLKTDPPVNTPHPDGFISLKSNSMHLFSDSTSLFERDKQYTDPTLQEFTTTEQFLEPPFPFESSSLLNEVKEALVAQNMPFSYSNDHSNVSPDIDTAHSTSAKKNLLTQNITKASDFINSSNPTILFIMKTTK